MVTACLPCDDRKITESAYQMMEAQSLGCQAQKGKSRMIWAIFWRNGGEMAVVKAIHFRIYKKY
jgi:hypothetical protein